MRATTRSIIAPAARPIDFAPPIETLQVRLIAVQTRLAAQPEPAPELNNLAARLTQLIGQAAEEERRLTESGRVVQTLTSFSASR